MPTSTHSSHSSRRASSVFSNERYGLLETIQEFAAGALDPQEEDAVRRRHRAYFVALAEASATGCTRRARAPRPRLSRLRERAGAVADALAAGEPDDVGRILGAVYPFLISHGHLVEVREWAEAALAARERLSSRGLAETLVGGGEIARFAGDLDRALELKAELASAEDELQRPNWRAATLADLCEIELDQGDLAGARAYAEQSAAAGGSARRALLRRARAPRRRSRRRRVARPHRTGGPGGGRVQPACALELLGEAARRAGDADLAGDRFRASLRSFVTLGDGGGIADCLEGLARKPLPPAWTTARAACSARPSACARRAEEADPGGSAPPRNPVPRARRGRADSRPRRRGGPPLGRTATVSSHVAGIATGPLSVPTCPADEKRPDRRKVRLLPRGPRLRTPSASGRSTRGSSRRTPRPSGNGT